MRAADREIAHDGRDVVYRELPTIQSGVIGSITGWISASVEGDAAVCARKISHLHLPLSDVVSKFMHENHRATITVFFKIELRSRCIDIRHQFLPVPCIALTIGLCIADAMDQFSPIARGRTDRWRRHGGASTITMAQRLADGWCRLGSNRFSTPLANPPMT